MTAPFRRLGTVRHLYTVLINALVPRAFSLAVARRRVGAAAARTLLRRRRRFHLALIAVILPDEMGEALAAEFAARAVPVVLISGHPDGIRRGPASGFPFLRKPFRAKDLLRLTLDHLAGGDLVR